MNCLGGGMDSSGYFTVCVCVCGGGREAFEFLRICLFLFLAKHEGGTTHTLLKRSLLRGRTGLPSVDRMLAQARHEREREKIEEKEKMKRVQG